MGGGYGRSGRGLAVGIGGIPIGGGILEERGPGMFFWMILGISGMIDASVTEECGVPEVVAVIGIEPMELPHVLPEEMLEFGYLGRALLLPPSNSGSSMM